MTKYAPVPITWNQAGRLALARGPEPTFKAPCVFGIRLHGTVAPNLVARTLNLLGCRHSALRYRFPDLRRGECALAAEFSWPLSVIDLREVPTDEWAARETHVFMQLQKEFDPRQWPLVRGTLIKYRDHCVLGLAIDHLVIDGVSIAILLAEFASTFDNLLRGDRTAVEQNTGSDFAVFAEYERSWVLGPQGTKAAEYWEEQWLGAGPFPRIALGPGSGSADADRIELRAVELDPEGMRRTAKRASVGHLTPFILVASAMLTAAHDMTGETDLGLLFSHARRGAPSARGAIGYFNNRLLLRTMLSGQSSFADTAVRVRSAAMRAAKFSMMPFESLVEKHAPDQLKQPPETPYLSLNMIPYLEAPEMAEHKMEFFWPEMRGSASRNEKAQRYKISVEVAELTKGVPVLGCFFNASVFDPAEVTRFIERIADYLSGC